MPSPMEVEVYVSIGSNIAPKEHITEALDLLSEHVRLDAISTFYRTAPLKRPGQPPFLNGVCRVYTGMSPRVLKFECLRSVEQALGRVRTRDKYAPRPIDLDIVLFGNLTVSEPELEIPDPDIRERAFVAIPLLELAPEITLPDTGEPLAGIVRAMRSDDLVPEDGFAETLRARLPL